MAEKPKDLGGIPAWSRWVEKVKIAFQHFNDRQSSSAAERRAWLEGNDSQSEYGTSNWKTAVDYGVTERRILQHGSITGRMSSKGIDLNKIPRLPLPPGDYTTTTAVGCVYAGDTITLKLKGNDDRLIIDSITKQGEDTMRNAKRTTAKTARDNRKAKTPKQETSWATLTGIKKPRNLKEAMKVIAYQKEQNLMAANNIEALRREHAQTLAEAAARSERNIALMNITARDRESRIVDRLMDIMLSSSQKEPGKVSICTA